MLTMLALGAAYANGYSPYPLEVPYGSQFGSGNFHIGTSCLVRSNGLSYDYEITVTYESDKDRLFSWDYLDWILSQYPNALGNPKFVKKHLFPLNGKGSYTFRFSSAERPLNYEGTHLQVFQLADSDRSEHNKVIALEYNGVTVSSYDYISAEVGLGKAVCLPAHLRVFPEAR